MCRFCSSVNEAEYNAEIMVHFSGRKYLDNPGVLTFPSMLVCLDCGSTQLTIPETELALLRAGRARSSGAKHTPTRVGEAV